MLHPTSRLARPFNEYKIHILGKLIGLITLLRTGETSWTCFNFVLVTQLGVWKNCMYICVRVTLILLRVLKSEMMRCNRNLFKSINSQFKSWIEYHSYIHRNPKWLILGKSLVNRFYLCAVLSNSISGTSGFSFCVYWSYVLFTIFCSSSSFVSNQMFACKI